MLDEDWKRPYIDALQAARYDRHPEGYYGRPGTDAGTANPCSDIDYAARRKVPLSTTAAEWPHYARAVAAVLDALPVGAVVLDVGCGDGRVTLDALDRPGCRVLSTDLDAANMTRLASRTRTATHRWLGWTGDARDLALPAASVDAAFILGLLHVIWSDAEALLAGVRRVLKPCGLLVNSEATVEGALLYAVARRSVEEFCRVAETGTKTVDFDRAAAARVGVVDPEAVAAMLQRAGFDVLERAPVPAIFSLIYGGWFRDAAVPAADRERVHRAVAGLAGLSAPRVVIFTSRKPDGQAV